MDFLSRKSIFQSANFAKFQQKIPYRGKTFRVDVEDMCGKISALLIRVSVGRWHWLWIPFGPIITGEPSYRSYMDFCRKIHVIARDEQAVFVRFEAGAQTYPSAVKNMRRIFSHTRTTTTRFTPDHTLVLDLSLNDEELLRHMKPKGRYNIKVAQKNGVLVKQYKTFKEIPEKDFEAWYEIMKETGKRDGFGAHEKAYYFNLLSTLGSTHESSIFIAYNANKEVLCGAIVTYHDQVGMYFYGASSYKHRALMAPYLVQWEAIKESRARDCAYYDFLGVSPPNSPKHHWAGVTDFKEKFGGDRVSYAPAFEIIHRPFLYKLLGIRSLLAKIKSLLRATR